MALPDLEALAIFARIAETGSLTAAAEDLGLSDATVSKALKRLEHRLGDRLIHRSSRRFSLTETGQQVLGRAQEMVAAAEAAEAEALSHSAVPRGRVRLAAPMSFGLHHVAPALPEFLAANPEVSIDLQLDDRLTDLVAEGVDVAVRIGLLGNSSLKARRLCPVDRWVVGAPAYFNRRGVPERPRDLEQHSCLAYNYLASGNVWRFSDGGGGEEAAKVRGPLSATNAEAFTAALEAGLGLALQPDFLAWEAVRDGRLTRVLSGWQAPPAALHLVTPAGGPRPLKVTVLLDFLTSRFRSGAAPWTVPE